MKLAIYGSGGLGREVLLIVKKINESSHKWDEFIFIDDFERNQEKSNCKVYNFDTFLKIFHPEECEVVIAVGEPSARETLFNKVKNNKYSLPIIIHPNSNINLEGNSIGEGSVFCYNSSVSVNVNIGNCCYIQGYAGIGHNAKLGNFNVIGAGAQISGNVVLGERVYMGFLSGIKENTAIGTDSIISAGSIVFRDATDESVIMGNPGMVIKKK